MDKKRTCCGCPWFDPVVMVPTLGESFGICQSSGAKVKAYDPECPARRAFRILRDAYRWQRLVVNHLVWLAGAAKRCEDILIGNHIIGWRYCFRILRDAYRRNIPNNKPYSDKTS